MSRVGQCKVLCALGDSDLNIEVHRYISRGYVPLGPATFCALKGYLVFTITMVKYIQEEAL